MEEATAREHYIKSLPGVGIVPDKYFSLRDPSKRFYFKRMEAFTEVIDGKEIHTLIEREYDLLEGQIAWDAWLLRHFIVTHQKHINAEHGFSSTERLAASHSEFMSLIFNWQEKLVERTGWVRKHDPGASKVISQIQEGHLLEAESTLESLIRRAYPERPSYKEMVRTITDFFEMFKGLAVAGKVEHEDRLKEAERMVRACSEALLIESQGTISDEESKTDKDAS